MGWLRELLNKEQPCKCKKKCLIGYYYVILNSCRVTTYRVLMCPECKNTFKEIMMNYHNQTEEVQSKFLDELESKGFINVTDMLLKIDKYKYTKLVEIETFDEELLI